MAWNFRSLLTKAVTNYEQKEIDIESKKYKRADNKNLQANPMTHKGADWFEYLSLWRSFTGNALTDTYKEPSAMTEPTCPMPTPERQPVCPMPTPKSLNI